MDISRDTDLETETKQHNELAQAGTSETGILEQVDLSTLQIIQKLFTGPGNGPAFLAQILRFAEVKQMALPGVEGTADVAVITLQTIRELAKKIQWGYDTTHKYVVVFCALNLLVKSRSEGRIQLSFSLKQYMPPPTSKALDDLINKSRPKVRQFAARIKHRCILYNIIQREGTKQERHSTLEQQLLQQLQSILQAEHIDPIQQQRLVTRISSEIFSKLIMPPGINQSLLPQSNFYSGQGKTLGKASSHIVDSAVPDPITDRKTPTHESTPAQADIVTSGGLLPEEEETRPLSAPSPEVDLPPSKQFKPPEEETNEHESPPTQVQEKLPESGETNEPATSGQKEGEPPVNTAALAFLDKLFDRRNSPTARSHRKQRPAQAGELFPRESIHPVGDSPTVSDPIEKTIKPSQASSGDSYHIPSNESLAKSSEVDLQAQQEVLSSANERSEDSQNSKVDSQAQQPLTPIEPSVIESPTVEKSTEQAESRVSSAPKEVDFSTITQINMVNYSESFLRAYVTLNVIDFINKTYNKDVNVTSRTELAKFLAEVMDNDCGKWKIHMKLLSSCQSDAVTGALIQVFSKLYDRGGDSIRNKAGLFTRYCKDFQADAVPPGTVLLANSLKQKTFEQMIAFFKDRQQKVEPDRSVQTEQAPRQTTPKAAPSSIYALEVPRENDTRLVKQGNRVVLKKFNYGGFTGKKKRMAQDY